MIKNWFYRFKHRVNISFKREEINGGGDCPPIMIRWTLFRWRFGVIYLHKFVGNDWAKDMHDRPLNFISIGLRGSYEEQLPDEPSIIWKSPWFRKFKASHTHRIKLIDGKPCWTLFIGGTQQKSWGFYRDGLFVPAPKYLVQNHGLCDNTDVH